MQVINTRDGSTIGAEAELWAPLSTLEVRSGESGTFLQPKLEFEWSEPPIHSRKIHSTLHYFERGGFYFLALCWSEPVSDRTRDFQGC